MVMVAALEAGPALAAKVTFSRTVPAEHPFDAPSQTIVLLSLQGRTAECSHPFPRIELTEAIKGTGASLVDVSHLKPGLDERRAATPADLYLTSEDCVCRSASRCIFHSWSSQAASNTWIRSPDE